MDSKNKQTYALHQTSKTTNNKTNEVRKIPTKTITVKCPHCETKGITANVELDNNYTERINCDDCGLEVIIDCETCEIITAAPNYFIVAIYSISNNGNSYRYKVVKALKQNELQELQEENQETTQEEEPIKRYPCGRIVNPKIFLTACKGDKINGEPRGYCHNCSKLDNYAKTGLLYKKRKNK